MKKRVPFFDVEYAMKMQGYVHNPGDHYISFLTEPYHCAVYYQACIGNYADLAEPCKVKCDLCRLVCETNDYIRGKLPARHPVPAIVENIDAMKREMLHRGVQRARFKRAYPNRDPDERQPKR